MSSNARATIHNISVNNAALVIKTHDNAPIQPTLYRLDRQTKHKGFVHLQSDGCLACVAALLERDVYVIYGINVPQNGVLHDFHATLKTLPYAIIAGKLLVSRRLVSCSWSWNVLPRFYKFYKIQEMSVCVSGVLCAISWWSSVVC